MLLLLRKIRKKLMQKNKFTTYILYAIGEIVLVVLGILIAVSINNWNEQRKLSLKRVALLEGLKMDYETNAERIDEAIDQLEEATVAMRKYLTLVRSRNLEVPYDSIVKYFFDGNFQIANFTPLNATYLTAQSTGDIGLLQDKVLLELFIDYLEELKWNDLHLSVSGDMVYTGSHWEMRKKLGSFDLVWDDQDPAFTKDEQAIKKLLLSKEFYAASENMLWIQRNLHESHVAQRELNDSILDRIDSLLLHP